MEWRVEFDPEAERELGKMVDPHGERRAPINRLSDETELVHIDNPLEASGKHLKG